MRTADRFAHDVALDAAHLGIDLRLNALGMIEAFREVEDDTRDLEAQFARLDELRNTDARLAARYTSIRLQNEAFMCGLSLDGRLDAMTALWAARYNGEELLP